MTKSLKIIRNLESGQRNEHKPISMHENSPRKQEYPVVFSPGWGEEQNQSGDDFFTGQKKQLIEKVISVHSSLKKATDSDPSEDGAIDLEEQKEMSKQRVPSLVEK